MKLNIVRREIQFEVDGEIDYNDKENVNKQAILLIAFLYTCFPARVIRRMWELLKIPGSYSGNMSDVYLKYKDIINENTGYGFITARLINWTYPTKE